MVLFTSEDSDQPVSGSFKFKRFMSVHWRGLVIVLAPIICLAEVFPGGQGWQWCAYTLSVMAVYWVTECIPLPVTAFLPLVVFPLAGIMSARTAAMCYLNDTVLVFLATIFLAYSIEQSGAHKRIALRGITIVGYSHYRLLFTISFLTMFVSMWITNTAATTMFVPFIFAVLRVFEEKKLLQVFRRSADGADVADHLTVCYFCATTFSATIGGIGTLVGTGTNLTFKSLFTNEYKTAPEYLSFPKFSAFSVPYMLAMEISMYLIFITIHLGYLRPKSAAAKRAHLTPEGKKAAQEYVEGELAKMGPVKWREYAVLTLFAIAMTMFFGRRPQMFPGWGDFFDNIYDNQKSIYKDGPEAMAFCFLMFLLPHTLDFFKAFCTEYKEDLKRGPLHGLLDYNLMNLKMPWSFAFLLGGGFCLSKGAGENYTDLNGKIGHALEALKPLPNPIIILFLIIVTIFITNFASNVAVCNVVAPVGMALAKNIGVNPLWYDITCGFSASYCFMLPVGTPGNLIVQSSAKISTGDMIKAGAPVTAAVVVWSLLFLYLYAPVIWPDLTRPDLDWMKVILTSYMSGGAETPRREDSSLHPGDTKPSNEDRSRAYLSEDISAYCKEEARTQRLAEALVKQDCRRFGLNELRIDTLDACLCQRYLGACKRCPRAAQPTSTCHGQPAPIEYTTKNGLYSGSAGGTGSSGGGYPVKPRAQREGWRTRLTRRLGGCFSHKNLRRRIPMLAWLPDYSWRSGLADMIAGITVGLTVIPQAIAYAGVAGLPPQYGLYSSFMACFVYTVFGSVKDSAIGPTAIAAILTRENLHGLGPEFAVLLCFLSGCVELLMGILQLGFLIEFISGPVSVGFTSAAAVIIATTQIKDILGLSFPGGSFLQVWSGLYEHIGETRLWDSVLGATCIVALLLLRKVKDIKVGSEGDRSRYLSQALWFLSTTRNILVVLFCAALAYYFDTRQQTPFKLTGEVKSGLPQFGPPPFSATVGNHTYTFMEMASTLSSAIFVVPLLSILENIALAKVFSEGQFLDATQEMIALGLCNMAASFVESMPVSGALSRGAVNHASGVATTAGGLYTGALVLLALQYLTPYFFYIPKASLAAVIIAAVVFMMELHVFKPIWRTKKLDVVPGALTFVSCLAWRLELGLVLGLALHLAALLYAAARPRLHLTSDVSLSGVAHVSMHVDRALAFPAAERVRRALAKAAGSVPLVLRAEHVTQADYTVAKGIKLLVEEFHQRGQVLIFYQLKPSLVVMFRGLKPRELHVASTPEELDVLLRQLTSRPTNQA